MGILERMGIPERMGILCFGQCFLVLNCYCCAVVVCFFFFPMRYAAKIAHLEICFGANTVKHHSRLSSALKAHHLVVFLTGSRVDCSLRIPPARW